MSKTFKLTEEEALERLQFKHGNVYVLVSKYTKTMDIHTFRCNKCGKVFKAKFNSMIHGDTKCNRCVPAFRKQYSLLKQESKINEKGVGHYHVIERHGLHNFVLKCKQCGWEVKTNHRYVSECKHCKLLRIVSSKSNVEVLDMYVKNNIKLKIRCRDCGFLDFKTPNGLSQQKHCCSKCSSSITRKASRCSSEEFENKLNKINPTMELVGEYVHNREKTEFRHKDCGTVDKYRPFDILQGYGCRHCNRSNGELTIQSILDEYGVDYVSEKKIDGTDYRYDFTLRDKNLIIEFDGQQHFIETKFWHSEERTLEKSQTLDEYKMLKANILGYNVIRVSYNRIAKLRPILDYILNSEVKTNLFFGRNDYVDELGI